MLYRTETVSQIGQSGIMMLLCPPKILHTTRQNLQSGLKSTEKQPKREKPKPFGFGYGRGRRIRTRDPRFWSESEWLKLLDSHHAFTAFTYFFDSLKLPLFLFDALLMLWFYFCETVIEFFKNSIKKSITPWDAWIVAIINSSVSTSEKLMSYP